MAKLKIEIDSDDLAWGMVLRDISLSVKRNKPFKEDVIDSKRNKVGTAEFEPTEVSMGNERTS